MRVAILLATYNGEKFLASQLDSFENQSHKNWCLYVLDDDSQDSTWSILLNYQQRWGSEKIKLSRQANQGSTKTFLTLVSNPVIQADYYAYADQDDCWDLDKIERALAFLAKAPQQKPLLYCATARLINESNQSLGELPLKKKPMGFANALVQCCTIGNTMVFNQLAREIIQTVGTTALPGNHDWWTYLSISACDGYIYYDPQPCLSYRLHNKNVVGFINNYFGRYYKRFQKVKSNQFIAINNAHIQALENIRSKMSIQSKKTLDLFIKSRRTHFLNRLFLLYKSRIYRHETMGTVGVYVAQMLGRL